MKRRIFLDSDVILDHLAERAPFNIHAEILLRKIDKGEVDACTSPLIMANLFRLLRKSRGGAVAKRLLKNLRLLVKVLPMDERVVDAALLSPLSDFEDALQFHCAANNGVDTIVTRNAGDFRGNPAKLYSPEEFLNSLN